MNKDQASAPSSWRRGPRAMSRALLVGCAMLALTDAALAQSVTSPGLQAARLGSVPAANAVASSSAGVDADFDPALLMGGANASLDLSRFRRGNDILPGQYDLDIYLNDQWVARSKLRFERGGAGVEPCIDRMLLQQFGANLDTLPDTARLALERADAGGCAFLGEIVEQGATRVDINGLRLDVSVPQVALVRLPRGYVDPASWDRGVAAALLRYRMNLFYSNSGGQKTTSFYLGTTLGLNVGSWRFRHDGSFSAQDGDVAYQNIATNLSHDIPGLQARLTLGDSFTDGAVFDSVGIRGIQLTSDDRMLPESRRGYAPVIRGVARSNARVSVKQNGSLLYETTVAAGPFVIDDLYATGYGAGLEVTVTEADGQESSFVVPFSSAPQLVRNGRLRFSVAAGELRDGVVGSNMLVARGSGQYGLSDRLTLYGGLTVAEGYGSALIGAAVNTPIGAFSADIAAATTDIPGEGTRWGHSVRLGYAGFIPATQTAINVATFMQSSSGYWDLRGAAALRAPNAMEGLVPVGHEKRRLQLSVHQSLGKLGQFYVSGSSSQYWDGNGDQTTAQIGYSKMFRVKDIHLGFNLDLSRTRNAATGRADNRLLATLNIPLGSGVSRPTITAGYRHGSNGDSSQQLRVHGTALQDQKLSYGAFLEHSDELTTGGGNIAYRGSKAVYSASGSVNNHGHQASLGVSGGIVVHSGGVTFAQDLGDTVAIVEAKGAKGARITSGTGARVDGAGYAVVSDISPYRLNTIGIDPQGLPVDTQFESTSQQVAPTAGAVVLLKYKTRTGRSALITIQLADNSAPAFGAPVFNADGEEVGVVGQGGRAFASGLEDSGLLMVDVGNGERCALDYQLSPRVEKDAGYTTIQARCRPNGITVDPVVKEK